MIYLFLMQPYEVVLIIFPFNRRRNMLNNFPNALQLVNCGTKIQTLLCLMLKPAYLIVLYICILYIYNTYVYTYSPYLNRQIASANSLQISAIPQKNLEAGLDYCWANCIASFLTTSGVVSFHISSVLGLAYYLIWPIKCEIVIM